MKLPKILFVFLLVIATAIICVSYFYSNPISRNIDTTIVGVQYRVGNQTGEYEEKEITIKGTFRHYVFGNKPDYFYGYFSIEGYADTFDMQASASLNSISSHRAQYNSLRYLQDMGNGHYDSNNMGIIISTVNFKEFVICVFEPVPPPEKAQYETEWKGWNIKTGLVICAPAHTQEEAIELFERTMQNVSIGEHREGRPITMSP